MLWESDEVKNRVQEVLDALEAPAIAPDTRKLLQRLLWRRDRFHGDGRGHLILLLRTVMESEGNGPAALVESVLSAVATCMRPEWTSRGLQWVAAFDNIPLLSLLESMRSLEIFSERSIGEYLALAINNRLCRIFPRTVITAPVKEKRVRKLPARLSRIPVIEQHIAMGMQLLELKAKTRGSNKLFSRVRLEQFQDTDPVLAIEATRIARVYGHRPDIFRRVSWQTLFELSSPSLSKAARLRFETAIIAGKDVKGPQVKAARGRLSSGRPARRERSREMMAA